MCKWKQAVTPPQPTPIRRHELKCGPIDLALDCHDDGAGDRKTFRWFCMSFGSFAPGEPEDYLDKWPEEAIRQARELLDKLEQQLSKGE